MTRAHRNKSAWATGKILIGAGIIAALMLRLRTPMLMDHATRIADLHHWNSRLDSAHDPRYEFYWLSDQRLLYETTGSTGSPGGTRGGTYCLWDVHMGLHTPLPVLTKHINGFREREEEQPCPSRDGQWIYMLTGHHGLMLCRLDGTQYREWNDAEGADWLPDSQHLVVGKWGGAVQRSVKASEADIPLKVYPPGDVLPDGDVLNIYEETSDPTTEHITLYGKAPTFPKKWQKNLIWPAQSQVESVVPSPQGDRIAYLLSTTYTQPLLRWMHGILPRIPLHSSARYEVWVCDIDGTQRKMIGIILSKSGVEKSAEVKQLHWLPGGKHLSFVYQETLFTVPID